MGRLDASSQLLLARMLVLCPIAVSVVYLIHLHMTKRAMRSLEDSYDLDFERLTNPIRALHVPLNHAISRSIESLEQLRLSPVSTLQRTTSLNQIRGWLQEAADKGDEALRCLEKMVNKSKH